MKTKIIISFFLFMGFSVTAQDIITLKNGDDIQALVQEIGEVDVKYKKFDNPNGPNYMLKKSEIFMIKYVNGSKDVFADDAVPATKTTPALTVEQPNVQNRAEEVYFNFWGTLKYRSDKTRVKNVETLFYDIPEVSTSYRAGKTWRAVGGGIVGAGFCIAFWDILYHSDNYIHNSFSCPTYWTGMGITLVGGIFNQVGRSKQTTAIDMYNASVRRQKTSDVSLNFGMTQSGGIGLTLNF